MHLAKESRELVCIRLSVAAACCCCLPSHPHTHHTHQTPSSAIKNLSSISHPTMADSAPEIAEEERHESAAIVDRKAESLANLIKKSSHFIAFTGAGVSTSAGVCSFSSTFSLLHGADIHSQVFPISGAPKEHGRF